MSSLEQPPRYQFVVEPPAPEFDINGVNKHTADVILAEVTGIRDMAGIGRKQLLSNEKANTHLEVVVDEHTTVIAKVDGENYEGYQYDTEQLLVGIAVPGDETPRPIPLDQLTSGSVLQRALALAVMARQALRTESISS